MENLNKFLASCEFDSPLRFWIGIALLLLFLFVPLFKRRRGLALDLGYWQKRVALRSRGGWVLPVLVVITSILMATVLTNPQIVTKQSVPIYGKPLMIVVDVSGSMEYTGDAGGDEPSTLEKARQVYYDILSRDLHADFGLLLYSTERYIARFFAYKEELLRDTLENDEELDFIATGTRTMEALAKARTFILENVQAKERAILLISDLEADPEAVLQMAEEMERDLLAGIKIYVIVTHRDNQGPRARPPSQPTIEGVTIVAMDDKAGIDRICAEISAMESSPIREEEILARKSLVPFLIPPILGLIGLCLTLSESWLRKIA